MNEAIKNIFVFLEKLGLVDVLLPFALIFAVTFGVLERVKVFGEGKRNVHIIVSFVMSFMVVSVLAYVNLINVIAQYFGLLIIAAISFALVYALLGGEFKFLKKKEGGSSGGGGSSGSSSSGSGKGSNSGGLPPGIKKFAESGGNNKNFKEE